MHGNVWEWCTDWYGDYGGEASTDPLGPDTGASRVFRGGSWSLDAVPCQSVFRNAYDPTGRSGNAGFREALSPSSQSPEAEQVKEQASGCGNRMHHATKPHRISHWGKSMGRMPVTGRSA